MLHNMVEAAKARGARPWELAEGGLLTREKDGPYLFTCSQLRKLTRLLRQTVGGPGAAKGGVGRACAREGGGGQAGGW